MKIKKSHFKNIVKELIQGLKENIPEDYDLGFNIEDDLMEEMNPCEQEDFCCKDRLSQKRINPSKENGICTCPKGSIIINC